MQRRLLTAWAILFALAILLPASNDSFADESEQDNSTQIEGWIKDLNSDQFRVRRSATTKLLEARASSIKLLEEHVVNADREGVVRILSILTELSLSQDSATSDAARASVSRLTKSDSVHVARLAKSVIERRQVRAITRIQGMGGRVYMANGAPYSIFFDGTEVEDEDLVVLREFPEVTHLSLGTTRITSNGLQHVVHMKGLTKLNLFQSRVGDDGLKYLQQLPALVSVPMGYTHVSDAGLAHLKDLTQLTYLGLRGDNVTSAGLVHIKNLTNLTGLYLGETKVTDEGLVHLQKMTKMEHIRLHNSAISDAGIDHLKPMVKLEVVEVFNSKITDEGVARLKEMFPDADIVTEE